MKTWDLFPVFNEMELLELRIEELRPLGAHFCAVELPRTFTDQPKPLYLSESSRFRSRVDICVPAAYPSGPHPTIDWFQRRQTARFIINAAPDDVVILSDVDEIPNRDVVQHYIASGTDTPVTLSMRLYYHRVDLYDPTPWLGTVICRRKNLGPVPDMQELRDNRGHFTVIQDGGWHFSWLGDGQAIKTKLAAVDIERESAIYGSGGIQEPPNDPEFLESCYRDGVDLFRRGKPKQHVEIIPGVNQPHEIEAWLSRYPQYAAVRV